MKKKREQSEIDKGEKNLKTGKEGEKTQRKEYLEDVKEKIKTVESSCSKYLPTGKGHKYLPCPISRLQYPPSVH